MVREIESKRSNNTIKFLCSYGGQILPRSGDGKLRYVGGLTRVLSVDRSISYAELMVKLGEFCGYSVNLRCQLPNGDLETLISIKSDEDLANLIEFYNQASASSSKIRAILSPPKYLKQISPPPSSPSSIDLSAPKSIDSLVKDHLRHRSSSPPLRFIRDSGKACYRHCHVHGSPRFFHNVPHSNYRY
ncbi:hypothetical protein SLE2022_348760 [Rubroshorea leprosula]